MNHPPGQPPPYVKWGDEQIESESGTRTVRAAWLVRDVPDVFGGERQEVMAYLGRNPAVTAHLEEEVTALYPDVAFDWAAVRRALADNPNLTTAASLTDDELALQMRTLARERGLSLMDLSLHLGYRQRQVLPELIRFLDDAATVARFERTSGSIFDYLLDKHPEYAFLLYKARLFFEGEQEALAETIRAEPAGFGGAAWRDRRRFWQERLDSYHRARQAPGTERAGGA